MGARKLNAEDPDGFKRIRTLVVDDSPFWLQSLCNLLRTQDGIQMVGTAMGGCEALNQMSVLRPDLVLMNLQMPDMNGLETTMQARRKYPALRVVLLTAQDRPEASLLKACEFSGVHALVTKKRIREELLTEIHQIFTAPPERAAGY